ncbi:hypothetical protein VTL71DRAFT_8293 [Oculimacula yallundae]|uniref:Guanine nucleotide-binding protein subunit gamma n=1 Tax=Oculimacula yallundae TaxID=86028 RepID=A0ABR4CX75_9HELO
MQSCVGDNPNFPFISCPLPNPSQIAAQPARPASEGEGSGQSDFSFNSISHPRPPALLLGLTAIQEAAAKSSHHEPCQPPGTVNRHPQFFASELDTVGRRVRSRDRSERRYLKMPSGYSSREDPGQIKKNKQSMADLKLRRLTELNTRLREDLERDRIPVSAASKSIISYTNSTKDFMVPSVWGTVDKKDDPYAPQQSGGCCVVM